MSEIDDKNHENFEQFDHMSTVELEALLKTYTQSSKDSDMDYIFYILEVIEKREKQNPSGKYTDVDTAWASFQKNYRPASNEASSLYDFTDDIKDNIITYSDIGEPKDIYAKRHGRRPIRHKVLLRMACVLTSLIIVMTSGTIVAKAMGFDIWGVVAKWTMDTFGFSSTSSDEQVSSGLPQPSGLNKYKSLQDALDNYNITTKLAPSWVPAGYILHDINVNETPIQTTIYASYKCSDGEIVIIITSFTQPSNHTYEKDTGNVSEYLMNGTQHYIMSNFNQTNISWHIESYECSISGPFSLDEAKKIINSIYERNSK